MTEKNMTYAGTGVSYADMDPFKVAAQSAAKKTARNIERLFGGEFKDVPWSRGESVYLVEAAKSYFAFVIEGLGTKNLVADAMYKLTKKSYYDSVSQDTVAMIVNDMITLGALPMIIGQHLAAGDSSWFKDDVRAKDTVEGWRDACDKAGCSWGCGETPTLRDMIDPETVILSGAAFGLIKPKDRLIKPSMQDGDAIIIIEASGIHANGLTMARKIAKKLPGGYLTPLPDGRTYGETLLDPTPIYVPVIEHCLYDLDADIRYAVNITGHGWRKLMRADASFAYIIDTLPTQLPIFDFMQQHGPIDDEEAYGNYNMGAGFALYVPQDQAKLIVNAINDTHTYGQRFTAFVAGHIEKSTEKKVVIEPKGLEFRGETLSIR